MPRWYFVIRPTSAGAKRETRWRDSWRSGMVRNEDWFAALLKTGLATRVGKCEIDKGLENERGWGGRAGWRGAGLAESRFNYPR